MTFSYVTYADVYLEIKHFTFVQFIFW